MLEHPEVVDRALFELIERGVRARRPSGGPAVGGAAPSWGWPEAATPSAAGPRMSGESVPSSSRWRRWRRTGRVGELAVPTPDDMVDLGRAAGCAAAGR